MVASNKSKARKRVSGWNRNNQCQNDTDLAGLTMPVGVGFVGATSDHTVITATRSKLSVGSEMKLDMNYAALMRAMIAPDIAKVLLGETPLPKPSPCNRSSQSLALV